MSKFEIKSPDGLKRPPGWPVPEIVDDRSNSGRVLLRADDGAGSVYEVELVLAVTPQGTWFMGFEPAEGWT